MSASSSSSDQLTLVSGSNGGGVSNDNLTLAEDDIGIEVENEVEEASQEDEEIEEEEDMSFDGINRFGSGDNDDVEDDPLGVKQLALNFDYLMYKISDRVKSLSEQTEDSITFQKNNYESDVARINMNLLKLNRLLKDCQELMNEFNKIGQIGLIAQDFKKRIIEIEKKLG
ncbi:hypothetical protein PACTADRAFT_31778 [Pachysolen tannophilus NRRL Y-2460]|uniref:Biogenesis of lysosome-related organelles complex 1 subunit CNL1 n=1 Tax=Pachysolen tannophilus NRRL Y-2460 TaxID=669874 RepID=A0A1E4U301_PACTA|nr:hypothetical protein PACTADRAFT_31778 [Pachysolen tannophilus NRRL Y-2460]